VQEKQTTSLKRKIAFFLTGFCTFLIAFFLWVSIEIGPVFYDTKNFRFEDYCDGWFPRDRQFGYTNSISDSGRILKLLVEPHTLPEFENIMLDAGAEKYVLYDSGQTLRIGYFYFGSPPSDEFKTIAEIRFHREKNPPANTCENVIIVRADKDTSTWFVEVSMLVEPITQKYYGLKTQ